MVKSRPISTPRPGCTLVPTWRTRMLPGMTFCPPKTLMPRCCPGGSRPLREEPCPFLCAMVVIDLSGGDAGDLQLGVGLAVAADAVPALFLRAEVPELAVLAVRDHLGLHLRAADERGTHLHACALADEEHLERHLGADRLLQLLHLEEVALLDAILLAARPDHCVHPSSPSRLPRGVPRKIRFRGPGWQGNPAAGRGKERAIYRRSSFPVKTESPPGVPGRPRATAQPRGRLAPSRKPTLQEERAGHRVLAVGGDLEEAQRAVERGGLAHRRHGVEAQPGVAQLLGLGQDRLHTRAPDAGLAKLRPH